MNAEEVYALLNKKIKKGGITDDQIRQIVEQNYGAWLPTNQVANSGQGNKDILYAGGTSTSGTREYYQGGYLGHGAFAGFCCLNCRFGLDWAGWHYLSAD